ncbi:YciI family protein [Aestuariicoccus sp. MJ-SS9]|uniref:YciI family protein n=1 Tax=Aestuariicoccus sp. MJ-SS9 TaxID=3079855 RepID=UPI002908AD01|nr:YciI family protein [Aestuariicoccus sp. MJ-SS9]MDU8910017.1 YciI family protein [Aestuariicoccus sp. MJ-SS9]
MLVTLIAKDKPGALATRKENREAHLAYLKATGVVEQAGPILDAEEQMVGSVIVLDVADMAAAQDWADNDPYAKAGLFDSAELLHWNRVIGK